MLLFHATALAVLYAQGSIGPDDLGVPGHVFFNLDAGVFLFFVLSGYLIGRPFASAFVLQTPFPRVGRYLGRRVLRLGPGLAAATLFALVAFGSSYKDGTIHFWTLGAEAWFYAVLPVATLLMLPLARVLPAQRARTAVWVAGCAIVAIASVWFLSLGSTTDFGRQHLFPSVAFAFAPGLALAALEPSLAPALRARPRRGQTATRIALALGAAALVACFAFPRERFVTHSLLAVAASALLFTAVLMRDWSGGPPWRVLVARPVQWVGERSYSLYLFHYGVVVLVARELAHGRSLALDALVVTAVATPLSLALAWAGHTLVERPFMRRRSSDDLRALKENPATIDVSPV